ncbi:MAG: hypothetical protein D3926_24525 [Desulfobacteraceae bacterium]|nr:MAG: hypothetical protein D3926_24525 [Desulfobacteraceae bacterium]
MTLQRRLSFLTEVTVVLVLILTGTGMCGKVGYNYISVQQLKTRMDAGDHENRSLATVLPGIVVLTTSSHGFFPANPIKDKSLYLTLSQIAETINSNCESMSKYI